MGSEYNSNPLSHLNFSPRALILSILSSKIICPLIRVRFEWVSEVCFVAKLSLIMWDASVLTILLGDKTLEAGYYQVGATWLRTSLSPFQFHVTQGITA